jgi:hypothetical protein
MSVADLPPGLPGPATIARAGFAITRQINRWLGTGLSEADRAAMAAARAAGYRRQGSGRLQGWVAPDGGAVLERTVIQRGREIIASSGPGTPGYRPDLTETPAKRPPAVPKTPDAPRPRVPGRYGRVIEGVVTVAGGILGSEAILRGIPEIIKRIPAPAPKEPPPPAVISPQEGGRIGVFGTRRPLPAPSPKRFPNIPVGGPPVEDDPIEQDREPVPPGVLTPIDIYVGRIPFPTAPAPAGRPTATPRTILGMSPAQLATLAVPTLLALLAGRTTGRGRAPGVSDPLTVPQTPIGFPDLGLTPGLYPLPWPGGSGFSGSGGSRVDQCECPPKRKRKQKQAREVCYSGTFIERASGLSKTRKRKVPCR